MELDTNKFKGLLEEELKKLEEELKSVGRINPTNPSDWEAVQGETNVDPADRNEVADGIEQYEENSAILKELETRFNNVKLALEKIDEGKYGVCEMSGENIELDRLEANPAARTCKAHMNEEVSGN
jgi:RNA polymerase-binding transcription factor DksA